MEQTKTNQLELCLKILVSGQDFGVSLTKPLAFKIRTPVLLPTASMLGIVEIDYNTSLVDLVKMVVKHHSSLVEGTLLEYVPTTIALLTDMWPSMS